MLLRSKRVVRLAAWPLLASILSALVAWRFLLRVEVDGDSMRPTLLAGDRLLVLRRRGARPGQLVVVTDPRTPDRLLVKRVATAAAGKVTVVGDNPAGSTDSRVFGVVDRVLGRPVYRYRPRWRAGPVG